ncbi:penicillin-binding transpeptidase domain-containing protein [Escherichia coli]
MALVGGFDFNQSKLTRHQALRQVGSNIKPFLYTAAMDKGLTLASMLNDVPISRWDAGAGSDCSRQNSPPEYAGPIRLRQGLGRSKNVVMVRAMRAMGRRLRCRIICNASASRHKTLSHRIAGAGFSVLHPKCRWRAATRSWRTAASWWYLVVYQQN